MSAIDDLMGIAVVGVGAGVTMKIVDKALGSTKSGVRSRKQLPRRKGKSLIPRNVSGVPGNFGNLF